MLYIKQALSMSIELIFISVYCIRKLTLLVKHIFTYSYSTMSFGISTTVINLLSIVRFEHHNIILIEKLNNFFDFDHNVFVLPSSGDRNDFISTEPIITPRSLFIFDSVNYNITGLENVKGMKSKNPFMVVVPEYVSFESNVNLLIEVQKIYRFNLNMKIGVFFPDIAANDDLQKLFEWSWNNQIINIFATFYTHPVVTQDQPLINIFTFNPFGTFRVINLPGNESFERIFFSQQSNFQQYPLRVGQPRPIILQNNKNMLDVLFEVMNASYTIVQRPNPNFTIVPRSKLFENNTMDMVINMFADNEPGNPFQLVNMYPFQMDEMVIIVPEATPYTEFIAYLRAASNISLVYSSITIAAVISLLTLFRFIKHRKMLLFKSVADVLNLLMNDNGYIKYQHLYLIELFLIVPLTFVGFFIVNGILSALQSHLTQPFLKPQIDSIEDIYHSPYPIFTDNTQQATLLRAYLKNISSYDWNDKVSGPSSTKVVKIGTFNRSTSFLIQLDRAKLLSEYQKQSNIKGYHIANLRFFKYYASFPVRNGFPFIERFNEIIHRIQSSGLYEKWLRDYLILFTKAEGLINYDDESTIEKFTVPLFIVYGWIAGTILLVIEIIWKNFTLNRAFCVFNEINIRL